MFLWPYDLESAQKNVLIDYLKNTGDEKSLKVKEVHNFDSNTYFLYDFL